MKYFFCVLSTILLFTACSSQNERGGMELYLKGKKAYYKKDLARAEKFFHQALDADESLHNARLMIAKIHYFRKNFDAAIAEERKILEDEKNHVGARYWLARTLVVQSEKNDSEAMEHLHKVLEMDNHHLRARALLALLYEKNEKYKEALREYGTILYEEERMVSARANLAILYTRLGLKGKAREEVAKAEGVARALNIDVPALKKISEEALK